MKEIVIISGKGGTGKTTVVLGFASLAENAVLADCDVDAADMFLVLDPETYHTESFTGGKVAEILPEPCTSCGKCREVCEFDAISEAYVVDALACEGCGACYYFCPHNAILFEPQYTGTVFHSRSRLGPFFHARLNPGQENSGKLVTRVRNDARAAAVEQERDLILVDGSPGVGCPVVASVTGADYVVVVTEPTLSGYHDLERVFELMSHFKLSGGVVINKFDIHREMSDNIDALAAKGGFDRLGRIPYHAEEVISAMNNGRTVIEAAPDSPVAKAVKAVWRELTAKLPQS
ncbi:MAG: (4Fe-4S)-binding protein [Acidobacteria bacterium]|nr:(4Fe-4S)-binding protein [Acidobacteriota bacterium]